ncbi:MAG: exo-alpha-sialidase [Acidobacteria bacterium]|nr:exo-alpha-sialidase [Acidobacteriota bacterium]
MNKRLLLLVAVLCLLTLPLLLPTTSAFAKKLLASFLVPTAAAQSSLWPTLEQQLAEVKAEPGSALDQLIRNNQQFGLLRLDEATDKRQLPPWIRVWWRKGHPELVYSSTDPTGGYPLVLKEVVEWMETHQDFRPGEPDKPAEPENDPDATISGEQRISGAQTSPRSESDIRINYFDPTKIISASNAIVSSGHQAIFFSTDSGTTWGQTSLPLTGSDAFHSDPTVDWTSDGRGWSSTLGINSGGTTLAMRNYFSTDNGANWTFEATPSGSQTSVDKQMVWADHNPSSPFFNQMYAIWHNGAPAFVSRRTAGGGGTWSSPLQVSGAESTGTSIGGDIKTNSAGDVFAFWPTTGNRKILVSKSTNGGMSYGTPVQIATTFDGFDIGVPSFNGRRALIYTASAAYKTPTKNLVYTSWTDLSGESGCTAAANEPGSNVASTCKTRIWFSRSADGGATWATPVKLNNQAGLNDQFNQWLVVDETTGALGIMYYDTVADSGRKKVHVYYQGSFDDGVTWSAPLQVTTAQTDETVAGADSGNQFGDYNGLSGYAGIFFPSWTDRRNNAREEIWTAKISDPACTAPGIPTSPNASATAANQITVSWSDGSPSSSKYNVYRAVGTCASPGTFTLVAANVIGTNYVDTMVSGGTTYSYKITGLDETGNCQSAQSNCAEATATGACTLPPTFAGLTSVTNAALATCTLNLSWSAATPNCGGPVTYTIYRATTPGFTPGVGNQIATGVSGTSFTDNSPLMNATPYYYVVRAKDEANSISDTNTVQKSGTPTGPVSLSTLSETFEAAGGFDNPGWTHQALSGAVDWVWSTTQSQTPTHSWFSASQTSISHRALMSPVFGVNANTTLSFWHTFNFETNAGGTTFYDGGTLEYSTNGGSSWTVMPDAAFTAGGFNATISTGFSNPIGGLRAWGGGTIGAMTQVTVNLASLAGNNVMLRWREGDDSSAAGTGWFVDSVTVTNAGIASACTPNGGCPTITITPATLPGGFVGTPYSQMLNASGGAVPYTFTLDSGSLPANVMLSGNMLTGTPNATGVSNFTIKVTDGNNCTATINYTVVISGTGLMFYPLTPCRLLDTRLSSPINGGSSLTQTATGFCGIPVTAKAIVGNATTPAPAASGFLTIFPSDAMQPLSANTNFQAGTVINNVFTVGLGNADGAFKVYASTTTHVVLDVTGYYASPAAGGLYFHSLPTPVRLADTRPSAVACVATGLALTGGSETTYQGTTTCSGVTIPNTALALVGNATTVTPAAQGFLTLFPANVSRPVTANGNYAAGQTLNSQFYVGLSPMGEFKLYTLQTTHIVIDVTGYFSTEPMDANGLGLLFSPMTPNRLLDTRPAATACFMPGAMLTGGVESSQMARGTCTIPMTAQAIVGNATVVQPMANGFLTLWPSNVARPLVANSNYVLGQTFNRHVTVTLGTDGTFKMYPSATTDLVIDLSGFFAP